MKVLIMKKLPMLSSITSTVVEDLDTNTLEFVVDGKQVTRKIKSEYFSNWSKDTVVVNKVRYLVDFSRLHHLVK